MKFYSGQQVIVKSVSLGDWGPGGTVTGRTRPGCVSSEQYVEVVLRDGAHHWYLSSPGEANEVRALRRSSGNFDYAGGLGPECDIASSGIGGKQW